jgi:protein involved in polysaccharide export with SLBB domain
MKRISFLYLILLLCYSTVVKAEGPAGSSSLTSSSSASVSSPSTSGGRSSSITTINNDNEQNQAFPGQFSTLLSPQIRPAAVREGKEETGGEQATADVPDKPVEPPVMSITEKALNDDHEMLDYVQPQELTTNKLVQFGYSFFRKGGTRFAPLTDVPVGPDYLIGVGDRVIVTLWGTVDGSHELEVNRNGEIVLPKVGAVRVAGVTYGQVQEVVRGSVAKIFKDFHLSVTMGKLRPIKVYLVGEVNTPGDYNLSSLSTLLNALSAAGGPTKNGSLRNIQVKRGGKLVETVDLYDFFLKGDKGRDIRLQAGDTVFVPTLGPVAGIAGNVRRPAIYELKEEKSLKDLLSLADGINPGGYLQRIQISRVDAHNRKVVTDFNLDPEGSGKSMDELTGAITIRDMDMVNVFPIDSTLRGYVKLEGYVLRPGDYAIRPGMRLSHLLTRDNLLPEYYPESGQITRRCPPDLHPELLFFNVGKALAGDPAHDLLLQEFDRVEIFSRWEMEDIPKVRINGEVQKPGEYRLFQNMNVRDLLLQAGNPTQTAYLKNAEISRITKTDGGVTSFPININLEEAIKGNSKDNLVLQSFDELNVRRIPNWVEETERYITLKGEFVFPGVYPIFKGEKLSSIIRRAGGFTDKAYLKGAKFTRQQIMEMQQKRMDEVITRAEADLTKKQSELAAVAASKEELEATKAALEGMMKSLEVLKTAKAEGRMVIRLSPEDELQKSEYNIEVAGGDVLEVPGDPKIVSVMGQVYNPTTFIHLSSDDLEDYLAKAGGATRDAEKGDIYIIKADGSVVSRQMSSGGFFGFGGFMSRHLDSGDTVVVPQRLERIAWMREIKDIAFIFGQIALTAGVLVAAGL